jgi:serine/threonine-protein kinase
VGDPIARLTTVLEGRYAIERELGAGGMATVYLAHDVRHDRRVALKVLRPELSAILGGERFLAEIKTTANLQHPHILSLFDSGAADGLVFYVMPYVDGESLRDRLNREHQLPVDEAVRIAREVASALDYAHRHNVVHRDIKPENILLHEGQALVADFGIALAASRSDSGSRMTETGMSLGTPHYMAPEQAMGEREITAKADIYALGCVVYEMLAGEPPFTGPTAQAIVARVMTEQPRSLTIQRRTIPPNVEAAVGRALEKLPADRFATAAEFSAALSNPSYTTSLATAAGSAASAGRDWRARLAIPFGAVAVVMTLVAAWVWIRAQAAPVHRYGLALPGAQAPLTDRRFAIAPDGARMVYAGPGPTGPQLWVKERDRYDATPITGTTGVGAIALSPDGTWIAFVQAGQLKKLPILGGAAITLADSVGGNNGLTWLDDGSIVFIGPRSNELRRVPDVGGAWTSVWRSDTGNIRFPVGLPGGRAVLFDRCIGAACRVRHDLWVLDLSSRSARLLQPGAAMGLYVRTGHVIYVREDGGMFALPFSLRSLRATGASVPVLDSVAVVNGNIPLMDISREGTLLVRPGAGISSRVSYQLVSVDRAGRQTLVDSSWQFRHVVTGGNAGWALSPDGRRLAIGEATEAGDDIWVKLLPRGPRSRLTFDSSAEYRPRWSPDGRWVDYVGIRGTAASAIYRKRADGTGSEELVAQLPVNIHEVARTRDEKWLVLRTGGTVGQVGARDIMVRHIGVDSAPRPLLASPAFDESAIALSPDGRWIAYETDETGRIEVYVRPFPNVDGGKWQVSTSGGVSPLWARSGRELFYVDAGQNVVAVPVLPGLAFRLGERRTLFHLTDDIYMPPNEHYATYDVSADGRFIMARRVHMEVGQAAPLIVVENWFTELNQKLGRR